jgi:hypothetical protein
MLDGGPVNVSSESNVGIQRESWNDSEETNETQSPTVIGKTTVILLEGCTRPGCRTNLEIAASIMCRRSTRLTLNLSATWIEMDDARLQAYEPAPGAHAYTAFMAWLALYGSEAEVAAGLLMNFAAWGTNCSRMSRALRDRYGLTDQATAFFDLFAAPPGEFESQAMTVVAGGLARGAEPRLV